jgi:hypothetical protein
MFTDRLSARSNTCTLACSTRKDAYNNDNPARTNFENDLDLIRVGLNYKIH